MPGHCQLALPVCLQLWRFTGGAHAGLHKCFGAVPRKKIISLVVALTLAEYLRGNLFSGFPWNAIGYSVMPNALMMQSASLFGLWGMTLLTLLAVLLPTLWLMRASDPEGGVTRLQSGFGVLVSAALLLAHLGYGMARLQSFEAAQPQQAKGTIIRLVQPNISQRDKWRRGNEKAVFESYLKLSALPGLDKVDAVIWPESAFPFLILEDEAALARINELLPSNIILLTGGVRALWQKNQQEIEKPIQSFRNSLLIFDDAAKIIQTYDKRNLVPFGEYMPMKKLLDWLGITGFVKLPGGFDPSNNSNVLALSHTTSKATKIPPLSILICYEIVFSGGFDVTHPSLQIDGQNVQAQWLLNITNDAWFGMLSGPHQHFHQARLRAVEQGIPMVRVANTGISAHVDSHGRVLQQLNLGEAGILDINLTTTPALKGAKTFFARFGELPFATGITLLIVFMFLGNLIRRRAVDKK